MQVIIGVDPHRASHTAVAIGDDEGELGSVKVCATRRQVVQLLLWAEPFEKRTWAMSPRVDWGTRCRSSWSRWARPSWMCRPCRRRGCGCWARDGRTKRPERAGSVAIAALPPLSLRSVEVADHAQALRLLAKRNLDVGSHRSRSRACTQRSRNSPRAEYPRNSTLLTRSTSSAVLSRPARSNRSATTWRSSSWTMSAGSTPNGRPHTNGSATPCARQKRLAPIYSVSARPSRFADPLHRRRHRDPQPRSVCRRRRHRTLRTFVSRPNRAQPVPTRGTADPIMRTRWPRSARSASPTPTAAPISTAESRGQDQEGSVTRPQAPRAQRCLPPTRRRLVADAQRVRS